MSATTHRRLPPGEVNCKWWMRGYCSRGSACYFKHDATMFAAETKQAQSSSMSSSIPPVNASDNRAGESIQTCAICFERPDTYGLLVNCDHAFCLECIRNWRATAPENSSSENELKKTCKTCPMCRSQSDFIVPSSIWPSTTTTENTMKMEIVDRYLTRLKTIPCKHFQRSIQESSPPEFKLKCPFGNHCHYSHSHPVTKDPYIFSEGELQRRRKPRRRSQMLDEMAIMEMLFSDLAVGYMSTEEDEDEVDLDDFENHFGFEAEFFGLSSDFDDFGYDYGWD